MDGYLLACVFQYDAAVSPPASGAYDIDWPLPRQLHDAHGLLATYNMPCHHWVGTFNVHL